MVESRETRRLSAILFTDIEGYSRMMQNDERKTLQLLAEHNMILMPLIEKHDGRIIKTVGDAILAVFDSCLSAVDASVQIQEALRTRALNPANDTLRVRIGIHLGETVFRDNDVFGNGVNIAARLQPLADPGGICISQAVYDQIQNHYAARAVRVGPVNLKNISDPIVIYRFQIEGTTAKSPLTKIPLKPAMAEKGPDAVAASTSPQNEKPDQILNILAAGTRGGAWSVAAKIKAVNVLGSMDFDFTQARFPPDCSMELVCVCGGVTLRFPPGVGVEFSAVPILGAVDGMGRPVPGGPLVRIKCVVVLGGIDIIYADQHGQDVDERTDSRKDRPAGKGRSHKGPK